jgi:hypothetical protein
MQFGSPNVPSTNRTKERIMAKRDINPQHRAYFDAVLEKVGTVVPLDLENIQDTISNKAGNKFPRVGQTVAILASAREVADPFHPFNPLVFLTSPPHHLEAKVPLFEFKMAAIKWDGISHDYFAQVCWSVFPDNRQVLIVSGLLLFTSGGKSTYEKGSLKEDRLALSSKVRIFMRDIIRLFPVKTGSLEEEMVFDALADLVTTI